MKAVCRATSKGSFLSSRVDVDERRAWEDRTRLALDAQGFDREGYNLFGRDRFGFDRAGFNGFGLARASFGAVGVLSAWTANRDGFCPDGYHLLHHAAARGMLAHVRAMVTGTGHDTLPRPALERDGKLSDDVQARRDLHDAVRRWAGRAPVDVVSRNAAGVTPLHVAVQARQSDVVEQLLRLGADANARTNAHAALRREPPSKFVSPACAAAAAREGDGKVIAAVANAVSVEGVERYTARDLALLADDDAMGERIRTTFERVRQQEAQSSPDVQRAFNERRLRREEERRLRQAQVDAIAAQARQLGVPRARP